MTTRREFLRAGGLTLAGLAIPPGLVPGLVGAVESSPPGSDVLEIRMRSDARGGHVGFDPVGARVDPGTTVRWVLTANVHSTTAYHPANGDFSPRIPAASEPWDSGLLTEVGQSFSLRLLVPGVYDYFCLPHELAGMVGRIVVASDAGPAIDLREPRPADGGRRAPSDAALATFPSIARIMREGLVPYQPPIRGDRR